MHVALEYMVHSLPAFMLASITWTGRCQKCMNMAAAEDFGSLADLKRRVKEVPENLLVRDLCFQWLAC